MNEGSLQMLRENIKGIVKLQAVWRSFRVRRVFKIFRDNSRNSKYFTVEEQMETLSKTKPYVG